MMNCGMMAEVIEDHGSKDITIRFEDGTIKKHQRRDSFNSGYIKNDNIVRGSILGVTETMNCGMEATVTEDYGCENITVQFADGTIREHCTRHNFKKGKIKCKSSVK